MGMPTREARPMRRFDTVRCVVAGLVLAGVAGTGRADPPPAKPDPELAKLWGELNTLDDERGTLTLLQLARRLPGEVLAHARANLRPVAVTREEADTLLDRLLGDNQAASDAALGELYERDPRLVLSVDDIWSKGVTVRDHQRLAALLVGTMQGHEQFDFTLRRIHEDAVRGDGKQVVRYNLHFDWLPGAPEAVVAKVGSPRRNGGGTVVNMAADARELWQSGHPDWKRTVRAVTLLESIGTPDAVALLKELAAGHPDARPTQVAKRAVDRLTLRK